jgi:FkbM family methyltransferase
MKEQQISDTSETPSTGDKPFLGHKREGGYTSEFKEYYHDFFNDKFVKEIVYPHREKGYFVDCGATNGVLQSQSLRLEQDGWRGLCIEPCWAFVDDLKKNRPLAQIENSAIVPKNYEGQHSFKEQNAQTLSSVILNSKQMNEETYKVNGSSIISILKKHKAPKVIDFMGIDIEGSFGNDFSIEEEMIKELLNSDYKVEFFSIEHYWPPKLEEIFEDSPYIKLKNPFLDGIWLSDETGLTYTLSPFGHYVCQQFGNEEERDINKLRKIEWESYYVHIDVVKENQKLKKYVHP